MKQGIKRFFAYARARHECYLMKQADPEWITKDKILAKYRFTNVFRELDKTTDWFRRMVRDPMSEARDDRLMLATLVFRLLNRIQVGEVIFCAPNLLNNRTLFDEYAANGNEKLLAREIRRMMPTGPYCTGGYIISSPPGYPKLEGMLSVISSFYFGEREWQGLGAGVLDTMGWGGEEGATALLTAGPGEYTLEDTWKWLKQFPYTGPFHSYEIVSDLRHTYLLDRAPDIMSWANPGPGARRGANRVMGRHKSDKSATREQLIDEMREVLAHSKDKELWPRGRGGFPRNLWPAWEMRDVEHTFCEFDKYERVRLGEGRPRGTYR